jgi:tungstate transport system permease protein
MGDIWEALRTASSLIWSMDADLVEIIGLSLQVSFSAVAVAALIGMPLGAVIALRRFPGRRILVIALSALMGLPPVVVGLVVYLLFSRAGPLGVFGLLFTPTVMIIAQIVLVLPIVASITREILESLWQEYRETLHSLGARHWQSLLAVLWDGRFMLITALLAGFGRAAAEVGAVMIVGGNIDHVTRVMTTAIALEASKGDLPLALGLGMVLLALSVIVNASAYLVRARGEARHA